MASHRYWRLYVLATNGSAVAGLTEIEFRATPGGADQTGLGSALASSEFSGTFVKAHAYDNGPAEWASFTSAPHWIGYDFVGPVSVQQVYIASRTTDTAVINASQAPKDFLVQWSADAVTWTTEWEEYGATAWLGTGDSFLFTNAQALEATKSVLYGVLGPPLLIASTKSVMYVITGPDTGILQRLKVRYLRSHE